jgi:5-methylcytosine-specific restriction endonuclease McrA
MMYIRKPFVERVAFNKKNILRRDHYTCQYCHRRGDRLTVDHVVPRSRGGGTTWTNVVAACLRCNLYKGNRTADEAGMALVRAPSHPQFLFSVHLCGTPTRPSSSTRGGSISTRSPRFCPRAPDRGVRPRVHW